MKAFFDVVRAKFGPLHENQVRGLELLARAAQTLPLRHRAYILATAWHETGPENHPEHMTPRREVWGPTKAQLGYEGRADLGNSVKGDGKRFAGRGYVQITGRRNYAKASQVVNFDLVGNPDIALDPEVAADIIIDGMSKGWFTGVALSKCATYQSMRKVVNGTDKAELIAGYAYAFEEALAAQDRVPVPVPKPAPVPPPPDIQAPDPLPPLADHDAAPGASSGLQKLLLWVFGIAIALIASWLGYDFSGVGQ